MKKIKYFTLKDRNREKVSYVTTKFLLVIDKEKKKLIMKTLSAYIHTKVWYFNFKLTIACLRVGKMWKKQYGIVFLLFHEIKKVFYNIENFQILVQDLVC